MKVNLISTVFFISILVFLVVIIFVNKSSVECENCNILLISVDTLGTKHMHLYGYYRNTTPFLDEFAKNGLVFENSYSAASYTLPSHISIFTSLYPSEHLVGRPLFNLTLNSSVITLPEILKQNGYKTGAIVSLPYLSSYYGYSRGMDYYNENALQDVNDRKADVINQAAFNWLQQNKNSKFFLFLHYSEVHSRWLLPKEYYYLYNSDMSQKWNVSSDDLDKLNLTQEQLKTPVAIYDGSVNFADKQIENVVDFLQEQNLMNKTIIIITGDHGEEFAEHERVGHGIALYQELIHVPLIVLYPKSQHRTVDNLVSGIDIAPTILSLIGVPVPSQFEGQSLLNPTRNYVISEYNSLATLIENNAKVIIDFGDNKTEFYNLTTDPNELNNINNSNLYSPYHSQLSQMIENFKHKSEVYGGVFDQQNFNQSLLQHLRELGYV